MLSMPAARIYSSGGLIQHDRRSPHPRARTRVPHARACNVERKRAEAGSTAGRRGRACPPRARPLRASAVEPFRAGASARRRGHAGVSRWGAVCVHRTGALERAGPRHYGGVRRAARLQHEALRDVHLRQPSLRSASRRVPRESACRMVRCRPVRTRPPGRCLADGSRPGTRACPRPGTVQP